MDVSSVSTLPAATPGSPVASVSAPATVSATAAAGTAGIPPANANTETIPSPGQIAQAVSQVNDSFKKNGQNLYASFEKDKTTGINVIKIVDKKTHETIRQMPIKAMLAFAQSLEHPQGARGKLIDASA